MGLFNDLAKEFFPKKTSPVFTDPGLERVRFIRLRGYDNLRHESFECEYSVRSPIRLTGFYGYSFGITDAVVVGNRFSYNEVIALLDERKQIIPMDTYFISSIECHEDWNAIDVNVSRRN